MRAKGMTYDTGFVGRAGNSREGFDPHLVRRELAIIRDDLHCNAVQITGGDPERLELAARHAAELGLEVWFSPYPIDLTIAEILTLFADCAQRAERLRVQVGGGGVPGVVATTMVIGPAVQCVVRLVDGLEVLAREQRSEARGGIEALAEGERVSVTWADEAALDFDEGGNE